MSTTPRARSFIVVLAAAVLLAVWPSPVEAQRRAAVRRLPSRLIVVRQPVFVRPYPFHWRSLWWARYGAAAPWGYWYGYQPPFGYGRYPYGLESRVRIIASPRDAEVFVDGYAAGPVDDFDGIFQRLRLQPGGHEIAIYREGYRTYREHIYFRPDANHTIRHQLEPLAPGEPMEPRPMPVDGRDDEALPPPPASGEQRDLPAPADSGREVPARFGTLSVRVEPGDAEVIVDGRSWRAPVGAERLSIELPEGRHVVEARKAGYTAYREDVLIRYGATLRLNVSLTTAP